MGHMREVDGIFANTRISPNGKLIALISNSLVWDEAMKGSNLEIVDRGRSVVKHTEDEFETVLGTTALSTGKHRWEIRIDRYNSDEDIFIGVAKKDVALYARPPDVGKFWGFLCTGGMKFGPES
jgi:hypothetical protein